MPNWVNDFLVSIYIVLHSKDLIMGAIVIIIVLSGMVMGIKEYIKFNPGLFKKED